LHPRSLGKRENDCTGRRAAIPNVVRSRNIVPLSIASRWRCSQYLERVIHRVRLKGRWPCLLLLHIGADDAGDRSAVGNHSPRETKLAQRFDFVGGAAPGTAAALLRRRHRHQPRRQLRGRAQRPDWFIRVIDYPYQCNFELGAVQRSFGLQRQLLYRL
jgi:hypothetical protein